MAYIDTMERSCVQAGIPLPRNHGPPPQNDEAQQAVQAQLNSEGAAAAVARDPDPPLTMIGIAAIPPRDAGQIPSDML